MGVVSITFPGNLTQVTTADGLRGLPSFNLTNGQIAAVVELASEYAWDPASTAADDGETVIRPTDTGPLQAGRWRLYSGTGTAVGGGGAKAATLAELKAAKVESSPVNLTAEGLEGIFYFTLADYTGKADDINIVKQDDTPLTTGAWVRQRAEAISYLDPSAGAKVRDLRVKVGDTVSVYDFGAFGDDDADDSDQIQAAIDAVHAAGGGSVFLPRGTYLVTKKLNLYSNVEVFGIGFASAIHFVNNTREGCFDTGGTSSAPLTNVRLRNFALYGDTAFNGSVPTVDNGQGIFLNFCDESEVSNVWVSGFSDGGIFFHNSSNCIISNCRVRFVSQGLGFLAAAVDARGCVAIGNRITNIGQYNGLHAEGSFGDGTGEGKVIGVVFSGNYIASCREAGINIEIAPDASCTGNTVIEAGQAASPINMGIKVFGSPNATIAGNTVSACHGAGIWFGANSGGGNVAGNTTVANGQSFLMTDSGAAVTYNVAVSANNFNEGSSTYSGNVSIRPQTVMSTDGINQRFRPRSGGNSWTVYENSAGVPIFEAGVREREDGPGFEIFRMGQAEFSLRIRGDGAVFVRAPAYETNALALAAGVPVNTFFKTPTGEARFVVP